jgi:hypothetical protein
MPVDFVKLGEILVCVFNRKIPNEIKHFLRVTSEGKMHSRKTDLYSATNVRQLSVCYASLPWPAYFTFSTNLNLDNYSISFLSHCIPLLILTLRSVQDETCYHHEFMLCILFAVLVAFYSNKSVEQPSCWEANSNPKVSVPCSQKLGVLYGNLNDSKGITNLLLYNILFFIAYKHFKELYLMDWKFWFLILSYKTQTCKKIMKWRAS